MTLERRFLSHLAVIILNKKKSRLHRDSLILYTTIAGGTDRITPVGDFGQSRGFSVISDLILFVYFRRAGLSTEQLFKFSLIKNIFIGLRVDFRADRPNPPDKIRFVLNLQNSFRSFRDFF